MANLQNLPQEVLRLIFYALQRITSGPRYLLFPTEKQASEAAPEKIPYAQWQLTDPGPLYLAATCHKLRDLYLTAIPGNIVLELSSDLVSDDLRIYCENWMEPYLDQSLLPNLKRFKASRRGNPMTRFVLESRWEAFAYNTRPLCERFWSDILGSAAEVFGDELAIVVLSQGRDIEELRGFAPRAIKRLEALNVRGYQATGEESLPSTSSRTRTISLRSGRIPPKPSHAPIPSTEHILSARPLSLHLYFGHNQHYADKLMSIALVSFANHNLATFYYSSDPNNLRLVGHTRYPSDSFREHPGIFTNPWRHLSPRLTAACETLKSMTLDCALFWSEIDQVLPYLHSLQHLDCELALLHTEPIYPFQLETKQRASQRILETCALLGSRVVEERKLKKNRGKKWLAIEKEQIVLPVVEPVVRDMAFDSPHSRFSTVDMKVCVQVGKKRIERSRRKVR